MSGRKIPRDGGIIIAVGASRDEIQSIIQEDPFHSHGLADFRIIEFRASQRADDIDRRIGRASVSELYVAQPFRAAGGRGQA